MTGIELITAERLRQVAVEGWTPEHDDEHKRGELANAAACYAATKPIGFIDRRPATGLEIPYEFGETATTRLSSGGKNWIPIGTCTDAWPWSPEWDKRQKHDRVRRLAIAGALIAAEIDRELRRRV